MSPRLVALPLALVAVAGVVAAQQPVLRPANPAPPMTPAGHWRHAVDAWDAGQYPDALRDLIAIAKSPSADEYRDRVALLTGEDFVTTELTTDGRNPRLSPDGRYASYEIGSPPVTRVARIDAGAAKTVAELPGVGAAFDPGSARVLYLRPARTPEFARAVSALETAAGAQERAAAQAQLNTLVGRGDLVIHDLSSGVEQVVQTGGLLISAPLFSADGRGVLFVGSAEQDLARSDVYLADGTNPPVQLTDQPGHKTGVLVDPTGAAVVYTETATPPFRAPGQAGGAGGRGGRGGGAGPAGTTPSGPNPCGGGRGGASRFGIVDVRARTTRLMNGSAVTMSADGGTIAWLGRTGETCTLQSSPTLTATTQVIRTAARLDAPALSRDGKLVAYQMMPHDDWELYVSDGTTERRITHEIQHDVLPRFLNDTTLLGMIGEPRHRRSYLYDLSTSARTRVFANNTIRTIAPEYAWLPNADGTRLLIQAERDGDTVSPERGVYVVDLTRKVSPADLLARLNRQLADETDLRQRMTHAYQPIADVVRRTIAPISASRVYEYEKALGDFDTKYIGRPGNQRASEYLMQTYASFGYTPEEQWFSPRQTGGGRGAAAGGGAPPPIRTANVIATLRGTENPDLIYVVGSHFDSVQAGPGADDDTSGTSALLEAARVLHDTPLPATVIFASFTGEEAGDLGSHEFVRLAAEHKWNVVGALNNDMIGWSGEGARMDNTIRYSNAGIRDLQHGAAFLFSNLITYDVKYYKSTDAQAFFDGWGDIVGGIGSYPVLGNPNYHQATDTIETVNFQQVAETAKVTAATIVYLASSPSRLKNLTASRSAGGVQVTWTPSAERGVRSYIVAYGPAGDPLRTRLTVATSSASLPVLPAGTQIAVKAVNSRGLEGWDWARTVVQ